MASNPGGAGGVSYLSDKDRLALTIMSDDIRFQSMQNCQFRNLAKPEKKFGAHKGQSVDIEKWQQLPLRTGELDELRNIPLSRPPINFVNVTIKEYGGGTMYTGKGATIAQYSVDATLRRILSMQQTRSMDKIAADDGFRTSDVFYTPTGTAESPDYVFDTDGTVTTAATRHLQIADFRFIKKELSSRNIPMWDGSKYMAVFSSYAMFRLWEDQELGGTQELFKYDMPEVLIKGELGSYFGFRFVEETNSLSNTLGTTSFEGEVIILGFEPTVEALVTPEHVEVDRWDFNRFTGIAWIALTGFKKVFTHGTGTPPNATEDNGEFRLVRVWST
jgi:N4-gp56 family major capsid protein